MSIELKDVKTYALRCEYLNQTGEATGLTADDLENSTVFSDVESEMSKCSGDQMADAFGSYGNNPLQWRLDESYERGILTGILTAGANSETFAWFNELLRDGGEAELQMLNEDDEVVTDAAEVDWDRTFAQDATPNEASLEMLDEAKWSVEGDGWDEKRILEAIKDQERFAQNNDDEFPAICREIAEKNGWVCVAKSDHDGDDTIEEEGLEEIVGVFSNPGAAIFELLKEQSEIKWLDFDNEGGYGVSYLIQYGFVKSEDLPSVIETVNSSPELLSLNIEENYEETRDDEIREIETEEQFGAYAEGAGKWDDFFGYVRFDGEVFTKADLYDDGNYLIYQRDNEGNWNQY